jgi:acylphosphatase
MAKIARHVRISGRVQGVFFRAWIREHADRLGVFGWIRNCPDGSVEGHVEGPEDRVAQVIQLLRRGPAGARVDNLEVSDATIENADWFAVRH